MAVSCAVVPYMDCSEKGTPYSDPDLVILRNVITWCVSREQEQEVSS